jgi:hypothetical protein
MFDRVIPPRQKCGGFYKYTAEKQAGTASGENPRPIQIRR